MIDLAHVEPDDWRLWRDLRLAALATSPAAFRAPLSYWSGAGDTEENWRARLAARPFNVVVNCDGEPAGMVSATADGGVVELHSMWAAPSARGHGVGDAAVRAVVNWAGSRYPGQPVVLGVKAGNDSAVRLYRRHGFTDAGPSPGHPDERLMRRPSLSAPPGNLR